MVSCVSVAPFHPTDACDASGGAGTSGFPEGIQEIQRMKAKPSHSPVTVISCAQLHHKPPLHS